MIASAELERAAAELAADLKSPAHLPSSTYRLQFHAGFRFEDARRLADYLSELGISHVYSSPILTARKGSLHGYDLVDPRSINPELGTRDEFAALGRELSLRGLKLVLDIVCNHMGIGSENPWWQDVLENGPGSFYADFFDIDWSPIKLELRDKVLLPVLAAPYGETLERGELRLALEDGAFFVRTQGQRLPLALRSAERILTNGIDRLESRLDPADPDRVELESILAGLRKLPQASERRFELELSRERERLKSALGALIARSPALQEHVSASLSRLNGKVGDPASFDALDALLDEQPYRLAYWRVAGDEINYRRFFDINELAALRMEHEPAFRETHQLVFDLVAEGLVHGLRVDHPDGLYDAQAYFERLQKGCLAALLKARAAALGAEADEAALELSAGQLFERLGRELPPLRQPFYIVAEKILTGRERLRRKWPIDGTTGYDFLNLVNGLFVRADCAADFEKSYAGWLGVRLNAAEIQRASKRLILDTAMAGELMVLGDHLDKISEKHRRYRDFTRRSLTVALREIIACFPVYRTYIDGRGRVEDWDRGCVEQAVAAARRANPAVDASIFRFVGDTLLLASFENEPPAAAQERLHFAMKFQQVTSPIMAKGVEDTAFYVYNRFVALNEVGGLPERFGVEPEEFHAANLERNRWWPASMLATSTHDTKRSEDVRARLDVLSESPREWRGAVARWSRLNDPKKPRLHGEPVPDRNEEELLYQTLIGAWPLETLDGPAYEEFKGRIAAYMLKAAREAKVHTSWIDPDTSYDDALKRFVFDALDDSAPNPFLLSMRPLLHKAVRYGIWNSLSQTALKLASPGVVDTYQGAELWDFSLVDPDNRRSVDFGRREAALKELKAAASGPLEPICRELIEKRADGRIKLYVLWRGLQLRQLHPELFIGGEYVPLVVEGERAGHVVAFARHAGNKASVVAVPRFLSSIAEPFEGIPLGRGLWGDTRIVLPPNVGASTLRDAFTGARPGLRDGTGRLEAAELFASFPAALLVNC
jgi:(1->4)-alpha-D-glucan 1-alpha-D-glucosylmutase